MCLDRYGSGVTLQVKIGSQEDFVGSVQESVLIHDTRSSSRQPTGSLAGQPGSPRTLSPPPPGVVIETTTNDGLAVQNFMNFIENSFECALLIEQHLVRLHRFTFSQKSPSITSASRLGLPIDGRIGQQNL